MWSALFAVLIKIRRGDGPTIDSDSVCERHRIGGNISWPLRAAGAVVCEIVDQPFGSRAVEGEDGLLA